MYILRSKRKGPRTEPWGPLGNEKPTIEAEEPPLNWRKLGGCGLGPELSLFNLIPSSNTPLSLIGTLQGRGQEETGTAFGRQGAPTVAWERTKGDRIGGFLV